MASFAQQAGPSWDAGPFLAPGAGAAGPSWAPASGADNCRLRSLDDLPPAFRDVFKGCFKFFNSVQSESFSEVAQSAMNVVLAAPTGSGKTVVMELAILQLLSRHLDPASGQYNHKPGCLKIIYLAPARALVQEKVREWTERFGGALGLSCKEVTGDTNAQDLDNLDAVDIICTTPEKFDAMTRRHRNNGGMRFFNEIALVLIDEVHLLNESRGSSLEAGVISRIKMVSQLREMRENPIARVRFVAVSATIPNIKDIADWLGVPPQGIKVFGEEMRPVKLKTVVRGYNPTKTDFLFERRLNDHISSVVSEFSKGKPTLVFCSSRKGTSETALAVAKDAVQRATGGRPSIYIRDVAHNQRLQKAAAALRNGQLKECIMAGVGFHHAAMEPQERAVVEQLFLNLDILVLCTTSTLAMGVNLPAHLVVIKGTRRYIGSEAEDSSGYQEYERTTCLQMVGRAGRPQFDTEGVAVIMTQKQHVPRYEQLISGSETVESVLKEMLPEFLNAEIALRTISDVSQAIQWLKGTFFYIRLLRNPAHYNAPRQLQQSPEALDQWMKERLVVATIQELAKHGLVRMDEDDGFLLEPLQPGVIMAQNYVRMRTMISICSSLSGATIPDLINIIARSAELANIKLRRSEKKQLNEINHSDSVRYHVMHASKPNKFMERISSAEHKIFILVNAALGDQPVEKLEYSLRQEIEQIVSVGARIAGAMIKYFQHVQRASETFNSYLLHKNFKQLMWTDSMYETRQLPGIGPLISERLAAAGIHKLQQLQQIDPRRLETITQRHYPFGNEVHEALKSRMPPVVELLVAPAGRSGSALEVEVTAVRVEGTGNPDGKSRACLLVGTLQGNKLLACRPLSLETFPSPLSLRLKTSIPKGSVSFSVVASVVHERLVGVDTAVKVDIPIHSQQQQQGGRGPITPNYGPTDKAAAEGSSDLEATCSAEVEAAAAAEARPAGPRCIPAAAAATIQAAAGLYVPEGMVGLLGQQQQSEARQFMQLQQQQQQPRSKGPVVDSGMDSATLAAAAPTAAPTLEGKQIWPSGAYNGQPMVGGAPRPLAAAFQWPPGLISGAMPPAAPGMQLPPKLASSSAPLGGGSSNKWATFISKPAVTQLSGAQGLAAGAAAGPRGMRALPPMTSIGQGPPAATGGRLPVQSALQQQQQQQATVSIRPALEGEGPAEVPQQQQQQLGGSDGLAARNPGLLFSQFRCTKAGNSQRPAQQVLLARLSGKQPVPAPRQQQQAECLAPAIGSQGALLSSSYGLASLGNALHRQEPAAAATATSGSIPVGDESAVAVGLGEHAPAAAPEGLPQKRKFVAMQLPVTTAHKENLAAAAPPAPPAVQAATRLGPGQAGGPSGAVVQPARRPALKVPALPWMNSRWHKGAAEPAGVIPEPALAAGAATAVAGALKQAASEIGLPAEQQAAAVADLDLTGCFALL